MSAVLVIARILFAFIFLTSGLNHLAKLEAMTGYAKYKKLPAAKLSVALSGVIMILGALSVIFGYYVDLGAILIIVFLVPASLIFHNFWTLTDPAAKQNDMIQFSRTLLLSVAPSSFMAMCISLQLSTKMAVNLLQQLHLQSHM